MKQRSKVFLALLLAAACAPLWLSCERPVAPENPNGPPDTRLANVPKERDTVFALVNLSWTGGDNDGFITAYQYRYFTYHLAPGSTDSWVIFDSTAWHDTTGTGATIAFNSTEALNMQRFLVRALDNDGNYDPTPAERVLYTLRTVSPVTKILSPKNNGSLLVTNTVTDWWQGVLLTFKATDPTGRGQIVQYAWSVDDGPWTWQTDTSVFITPEKFSGAADGTSRDQGHLPEQHEPHRPDRRFGVREPHHPVVQQERHHHRRDGRIQQPVPHLEDRGQHGGPVLLRAVPRVRRNGISRRRGCRRARCLRITS